jgi:hypothetical protein
MRFHNEIQIDLLLPISQSDLIAFVESGHNMMIFGDEDAKKPVRSLFNEFGADLEDVVSLIYKGVKLLISNRDSFCKIMNLSIHSSTQKPKFSQITYSFLSQRPQKEFSQSLRNL